MKKNNALLLLLVLLNCITDIYAQNYNNYEEEVIYQSPKTPGAANLINNIEAGNDLHAGKVKASIPLYTYDKNGLNLNLHINYVAGNGIKVNDVATRYGLGWDLAGAATIIREIKGGDDLGINGFLHLSNHPDKIFDSIYNFLTIVENGISLYDIQVIINEQRAASDGVSTTANNVYGPYLTPFMIPIINHLMQNTLGDPYDLEPDMYYITLPNGISGKFTWSHKLKQFVSDNPAITAITLTDIPGDQYVFNITDKYNNTYEFYNKVISLSGIYKGTPLAYNEVNKSNIIEWKISKALNAAKNDSIIYRYYPSTIYQYYDNPGSCNVYRPEYTYDHNVFPPAHTMPPNYFSFEEPDFVDPSNTWIYCRLTGALELREIIVNKDSILFNMDHSPGKERLDLDGGYVLDSISIYRNKEMYENYIFKFNYFNRNTFVGTDYPDEIYDKKSIKLDKIIKDAGINPEVYSFEYLSPNMLPARACFKQDLYGLANSNTHNASMIPYLSKTVNFSEVKLHPIVLGGADRSFNFYFATAGLLSKINYPLGGNVTFQYEQNDVLVPSPGVPMLSRVQMVQTPVPLEMTYPALVNEYTSVQFNLIDSTIATLTPYFPSLGDVFDGNQFTTCALTGSSSSIRYQLIKVNTNNTQQVLVDLPYNAVAQIDTFGPGKYFLKIKGLTALNGRSSYCPNTVTFTMNYLEPDTNSFWYGRAYGNELASGIRLKSKVEKDPTLPSGQGILYTRYHYRQVDTSFKGSLDTFYSSGIRHDANIVLMDSFYRWTRVKGWLYQPKEMFIFNLFALSKPIHGFASPLPVTYSSVVEEQSSGTDDFVLTAHYFQNAPLYNTKKYPILNNNFIENNNGLYKGNKAYKYDLYDAFSIKREAINTYSNVAYLHPDYYPAITEDDLHYEIQGIKADLGDAKTILHAIVNGTLILVPRASFLNLTFKRNNLVQEKVILRSRLSTYLVSKAETTTKYKYGPVTNLPVQIINLLPNKDSNTVVKYYAGDVLSSGNTLIHNAFKNQLLAHNRPALEIASQAYKNNTLLYKSAKYGRVQNDLILIDSTKSAKLSYPLERDVFVEEYNEWGLPLMVAMKGNVYQNYSWTPDGKDMIAKFELGQKAFTYYSSFEYEDNVASMPKLTGSKSYNLAGGNLSIFNTLVNNPQNYVVYGWTNNNAPFAVNGQPATNTGHALGSWQLYKYEFISQGLPATIHISGSGYLDDLSIMPMGAMMSGFVYNQLNQISSTTNGYFHLFYEYDAEHKLKAIKNQEGKIVEAYEYGIQKP